MSDSLPSVLEAEHAQRMMRESEQYQSKRNIPRPDQRTTSNGVKRALTTGLASLVALLGSYACGGSPTDPGNGGGNGGNQNQRPSASLQVTPTSGESPLEVRIQLDGSDSDGSVTSFQADLNGDGDFQDQGEQQSSPIDVTRTYEEDVTISGRVRDNDGAFSSEKTQSVSVQQPSQVTLTAHLRNLTRDGEPHIRNEGDSIRYVIGKDTIASQDSVVVELEPGTYEIFALHNGVYKPWGLIKEEGTPKFEYLEKRDVQDQSSAIDVQRDMVVEIYKIKKEDIEGEGYTIEDVALVIDNPNRQSDGTDRYTTRSVPNWLNTTQSDSIPQSGKEALEHWATTEKRREGAKGLTDGFIQEMQLQSEDNQSEPNTPHYNTKFINEFTHSERVVDNEIQTTFLRLGSEFDYPSEGSQAVLEEGGQGLGIRDDLPGGLVKCIAQSCKVGEYKTISLRIGKILYHFPPGTHFHQE